MMRAGEKPSRSLGRAVVTNVGLAIVLVAVTNMLIFSYSGFSSAGTSGGRFIPPIPGWVIGVIWTVLFAGLGATRGVMDATGTQAARRASLAVLALLAACVAYPFYTLGLHNTVIGLIGNIATMCMSVWVAVRVGAISRFGLVAPLAVASWLLFATLALLDAGLF